MSAVCVPLLISHSPFMASRLPQTPIIDLPPSAKAFSKHPQTTTLVPLLPRNSPSFHCSFKRKVLPPPRVSRSNAVSDQVIESLTSDSTQDSETAPSSPSSSKLVLVAGGTGGVGNLLIWNFVVGLRGIILMMFML